MVVASTVRHLARFLSIKLKHTAKVKAITANAVVFTVFAAACTNGPVQIDDVVNDSSLGASPAQTYAADPGDSPETSDQKTSTPSGEVTTSDRTTTSAVAQVDASDLTTHDSERGTLAAEQAVDEIEPTNKTTTSTSTPNGAVEPEIVSFSVKSGGTVTVEDGIFATYYDENGELLQSGTCSYAEYSYIEVVDFAASFQTSLIERSPSATGQFLLFPLRVIVSGTDEPLIIENAAQLEARYDEIITAQWVADVLEVDPVTVFCRYDGFMLGRGLFWADPTTGVFTIIHPTP